MTLEAHLQRYLAKSGDRVDNIVAKNLVANKHGWFDYELRGDILYVIMAYGNGDYWNVFAHELAKKLNCKYIQFFTKRNPKAMARRFNVHIDGYIMIKEV